MASYTDFPSKKALNIQAISSCFSINPVRKSVVPTLFPPHPFPLPRGGEGIVLGFME